MPATAGRVRMPANNRVHSSVALQTHGIWQSAIGYDPYAPNQTANAHENTAREKSGAEQDGENAYDSFQGLLALARLTASNEDEDRGACKKCSRVGHLTFQCRNFLSVKDDIAFHDKDQINKDDCDAGTNNFIKVKSKVAPSEESEEEVSSELTDSDEDSEMERILARKFGNGDKKKKHNERSRVSSKKSSALARRSKRSRDSDSEDSEDDRHARRGRSRRKKSAKSRRESRREDSDVDSKVFSDKSSEEERKLRRKKKKMMTSNKRSTHCCTDTDSGSEEVKRRKRKNMHDRSRRKPAVSDSNCDDEDHELMRRKRVKKHISLKSN